MLPATDSEISRVRNYVESRSSDLSVTFVQKVYAENVLQLRHEIWDVHTNKDRWWVITEPMNLYSQEQFPNMDLALTFHVGLCLRVPRSERTEVPEVLAGPFLECFRGIEQAQEALEHVDGISDYQAIGVRCREALLTFTVAAQNLLPWVSAQEPPKKGDFRAWSESICNTVLPGAEHEHRRHLYKTLLETAWKYVNWLTHAKASRWHDAEAGVAVTGSAITSTTNAVILHTRGVPSACPQCGFEHFSPERGIHTSLPDVEWERPVCDKCGWTGTPVAITNRDKAPAEAPAATSKDCVVQSVPLRSLTRPPSD